MYSSTGSNTTIDLARAWIHRCASSHAKCRKASEPQYFPSRLIDVGTTLDPQVRLRHGMQDPLNGRYVTLRHYPGFSSATTLTQSNEDQMRSSMPFAELPPTVKNAIQIARVLGVRYLWTEPLCTVQDPSEDWRRKPAVMNDVYRNSVCNIAATKPSISSQGLFIRRNPMSFNKWVALAVLHWTDGKDQAFFRNDCGYWSSRVGDTAQEIGPWGAQERKLIPRSLYFCQDQVLWRCDEGPASEEYPTGLPFGETRV